NTFCPEGEVCKHGFLIKSPPLQLFGSQNSWKRRFFILSKSSKGNYILKYLKGQNTKGSIAVDQIINIEVGISNSEVMETVRKMFKCLPEQVMSIRTGNRCYYLIGSSRQETEDWVTVISSVCRETTRGGCCPQVTSKGGLVFSCHKAVCRQPIWRKLNAGEAPPGCLQEESTFFFCIQENGPSEDKSRPNSDPGPHQAQCDSPGGVFPKLVDSFTHPLPWIIVFAAESTEQKAQPRLYHTNTDEDIKKDEEDYYQTPSSILAKDESSQLTCRNDELLSPPKHQDNGACPGDLEANRDLNLPESSTSQHPALQRRQNSLSLSVVQLSILLSQVTDETQLEKLDIFIPLADIYSYLKLTEAAGQI
ncbi:Pleckstrin homology domain-containing family S member 1, partial [Pterocles gutturalis]